MASSFFNIGSIVGGLALAWWLEPTFFSEVLRHLSDHHGKLPPLPFGEKALVGLAIGTLLGGLLQLVTQLPSLRRVGFSFRPDFRWRDSGVREVLVLMVPSVIAASAVQVNVLINTSFASSLGPSAVTWLNNAFRLQGLDAWGRYYGDAVFSPFEGSGYTDQSIKGSIFPFSNATDFGDDNISQYRLNTSSFSSLLSTRLRTKAAASALKVLHMRIGSLARWSTRLPLETSEKSAFLRSSRRIAMVASSGDSP